MLGYILGIQLAGLLGVAIIRKERRVHRLANMLVSLITMYIVMYMLLVYNTNNGEYQNREWFSLTETLGGVIGVDGISMSMIVLMSIIDPILILISRGEVGGDEGGEKRINMYMIGMKVIIYTLFMCIDLLVFFITYELVLIPIFLLITRYGSKYKYYIPRVEAGIRIMIYTIVGSLFMLVAIAYLYSMLGTTSSELLHLGIINTLSTPSSPLGEGGVGIRYVWLGVLVAFLIKVPMYPLHTWLPLAHSDAPTVGSVILAALLLKLASYGILRYTIGIYSLSLSSHTPLDLTGLVEGVYVLAGISIISSSLIALRALYDLKKIIAYSSIVHMNFSIFGFFSKDLLGLIGATYLIHTHALVASCLFLLVGMLYKRYHSRYLPYYQGLAGVMPLFALLLMLATFSNISLPFCAPFLAEIFILYSTYVTNTYVLLLLLASLVLSSAFMIWLTNRLLFGTPSSSLLPLYPLHLGGPGGTGGIGRTGGIGGTGGTEGIGGIGSSGGIGGTGGIGKSGVGAIDITRVEFLSLLPLFFLIFYLAFFPSTLLTFFYLPLTLLL